MAEPPDKDKVTARRPAGRTAPEAETSRDRFATAIARAELGRFYWSEASERALRAAMAKKPKPRK